jgi:hypothetical protein
MDSARTTQQEYAQQETIGLPFLEPVENYPQTIGRNGIRVSVEPQFFKIDRGIRTECQQNSQLLVLNDKYSFTVTGVPVYKITPNKPVFKIRINNNLDRVLRMAGSVVIFQVNNKNVAIEKSAYQDLLGGVILPRQESEFEIAGPDISSIEENSTVSVLLYDVVTKTDAAGNPTERSNFEWFFKYNKLPKTINYAIKKKKVSMPPSIAESYCGKILDYTEW